MKFSSFAIALFPAVSAGANTKHEDPASIRALMAKFESLSSKLSTLEAKQVYHEATVASLNAKIASLQSKGHDANHDKKHVRRGLQEDGNGIPEDEEGIESPMSNPILYGLIHKVNKLEAIAKCVGYDPEFDMNPSEDVCYIGGNVDNIVIQASQDILINANDEVVVAGQTQANVVSNGSFFLGNMGGGLTINPGGDVALGGAGVTLSSPSITTSSASFSIGTGGFSIGSGSISMSTGGFSLTGGPATISSAVVQIGTTSGPLLLSSPTSIAISTPGTLTTTAGGAAPAMAPVEEDELEKYYNASDYTYEYTYDEYDNMGIVQELSADLKSKGIDFSG